MKDLYTFTKKEIVTKIILGLFTALLLIALAAAISTIIYVVVSKQQGAYLGHSNESGDFWGYFYYVRFGI